MERQFATADINTVISVIRKGAGNTNVATRFIQLRAAFETALADAGQRREIVKSREELRTAATSGRRFVGDKWGGKYLRGLDIYHHILDKYAYNLVRLGDIASVKFGIKTGANPFFHLKPEVITEWGIEPEFCRPVMTTPQESRSLAVDPAGLPYRLFMCQQEKANLAGTGALAATLLEEGANSPADVFYAQDPGGLAAVSGMLTTLPGDIVELTPEWAHSEDGRWVGITGRARVVVYGTDDMTEADLPDDLWGFTEARWRGRVGWAPTNGSFQAMVTALRVGWGEARAEEWLRAMLDNEVQVYPKNTPQVAAAAAGEIDAGLVNHYYLYRFIAEEGEDFGARNAHLRGAGPGAIVLVSGAGILKTAENAENAEAFIRFLLSKVGQQYFAGSTFEYPMVAEVRPSVLLTPLDEIRQPGITLADLSDLAGTQALLQKVGALP